MTFVYNDESSSFPSGYHAQITSSIPPDPHNYAYWNSAHVPVDSHSVFFCRGRLYVCPLMPRCGQGNRKGLPLQNTDIVTGKQLYCRITVFDSTGSWSFRDWVLKWELGNQRTSCRLQFNFASSSGGQCNQHVQAKLIPFTAHQIRHSRLSNA